MREAAFRVAYITSVLGRMPERFIATDVRALRDAGAEVSIHSLRNAPAGLADRLGEWGIAEVPRTYNSIPSTIRGLGAALRQPRRAAALLAFLVRCSGRRPTHLARGVALLPRVLDIARRLEEDPPDVVHAFWGHYPALVLRALRGRIPQTVRSHFLGAYDLTMEYGCSGPVAREADVVWTHAEVNRPALLNLGVDSTRLAVAHRGVELGAIPAPGAITRTRRRVVTVGRLIPAKGFDAVLEAFRLVADEWPDASLEVVGDGPARKALAARARRLGLESRVTFRGVLPHAEVLEAMARAEALVLLSTKEGERLPNVVKEALACGTPVVVGHTPGIEELVPRPELGTVVDPRDIPAAAAALSAIFRSDGRGAEADARRFIQEHFSTETQMAIYLARWRELAGLRNP